MGRKSETHRGRKRVQSFYVDGSNVQLGEGIFVCDGIGWVFALPEEIVLPGSAESSIAKMKVVLLAWPP